MNTDKRDTGDPRTVDDYLVLDGSDATPGDVTSDGSGPRLSRRSFDPESGSLTQAVVDSVSSVADTPPDDLGPLYDVLDGDALEVLVGGPRFDGHRSVDHVEFAYEGTRVTVRSSGVVEARMLDGEGR